MPSSEIQKATLDRRELAALLGIGIRTLDRHLAAGLVPGRLALGGRALFSREIVVRWIAAGCPRKFRL